MQTVTFKNDKLELAERIVCNTDSHVFLTGKAGTGKTTFLRKLRGTCYKRMVVVAPTGVAAINAEGVTIHSFFQLPFGPHIPKDSEHDLLAAQKLTRNKIKIIRSLDLLVIDEISMVRADVLDAVDEVLRRVRRSTKPFGGVQLLMIGDIHQLAPVAKNEEWMLLAPYYDSVYFFNSHALSATNYICIELDHIYRQSDARFIDLLNKVRCHNIDAGGLQQLNSRYVRGFDPDDDEGYITLTTHNYQADTINNDKLDALTTKPLLFEARVKGVFPENNYPTKKTLELKIGARVMFVKNDPSPEKRYYNGKIGTLIGYDEEEEVLTVESDDENIPVSVVDWINYEYGINPENNEIVEKEIGCFSQIPLRLAWAVTIHKSQGLTFDKVIVDAGQAFAHGQVYVALSRCTTLEGIVLKTIIQPDVLINDVAVDVFDNDMSQHEASEDKLTTLQHEYQYSMMVELFNFDHIERDFSRLAKLISNNYTLFGNTLEQDIINQRNAVGERFCDVAHKFENQVKRLHFDSGVVYTDNEPLQTRLRQANGYFMNEVIKCKEKVDAIHFEIDNKEVKKQINEILRQLRDDIFVKQKTLEACRDSFTVEKYQKAKAYNTVEAEKTEMRLPVDVEIGSLLWKLRSWRAAQADMADVTEASIVPIKALMDISRLKPTTLEELKAIPKLGKKRIALYGAEIIGIVAEDTGVEVPKDLEQEAAQLVANTYEQTRRLIEQGLSIAQIAERRHLTVSTIENHVARFIEKGECDIDAFVDRDTYCIIYDYFKNHPQSSVSAAKEALKNDYGYGTLRMVHAQMKYEGILDMD